MIFHQERLSILIKIFKTFIKRLFPRSFDNEIYNLTPKDLIIRKSSNHGGFKFGLSLLIIILIIYYTIMNFRV